jgi:hypothetical protein
VQQRREVGGRDTARDHVGVQRVDQRILFPVVAEEILARRLRVGAARLQQLGELVADLLAQMAELAAEEALQLILEDDAVVEDPVELELAPDRPADLRRARREEVHPHAAPAPQRRGAQPAHERRHPRRRDLVLRALERNAHHLPQALELAEQVGLVEVPAKDQRRISRHRLDRSPRRPSQPRLSPHQ